MDPTDLRAELAEWMSGTEPIDAKTFNAACFMLSRALEGMEAAAAALRAAEPVRKSARFSA